jgi:hypothetical protein
MLETVTDGEPPKSIGQDSATQIPGILNRVAAQQC